MSSRGLGYMLVIACPSRFWSAKASDYLRGYFHAAALMGTDLRTAAAWDIRL